MSFILDALKKSEGERQRQSGPALFEVKVAPPKARFPAWAIAVGALLIVNLGVVAWFALRSSPAGVAHAQPAVATARPIESGAAAPAPPPALTAAAPQEEVTLEPGEPESELIAEDFEPAVSESAAPPASMRVTRGTDLGVPTYEQLASTPGASLPELRLDLHVFASEPGDRFVFLNNRRVREGETLPDGTLVESIVPDGVVLSVRGKRFLLQRQ